MKGNGRLQHGQMQCRENGEISIGSVLEPEMTHDCVGDVGYMVHAMTVVVVVWPLDHKMQVCKDQIGGALIWLPPIILLKYTNVKTVKLCMDFISEKCTQTSIL